MIINITNDATAEYLYIIILKQQNWYLKLDH